MFKQATYPEKLLFLYNDLQTDHAYWATEEEVREVENLIPKDLLRKNDPNIPDLPEPVIVRHFTKLSRMNYAIDIGPYPLGSCTMKYNPKYMERLANNKNISLLHDILPEENCQGILLSLIHI